MTELRAEFVALKTTLGTADPVRLRYIESLLLKAETSRGRLASLLERRVGEAMEAFRVAARERRPGAADESGHPQSAGIRQLTRRLNTAQREEPGSRDGSFEETLRQQELAVVDALAVEAGNPAQNPGGAELKAARQLRCAMVRLHADRVVSQALADVPAEAGPLNPQRLATDSLQTMKALSPHYLTRFVSYIDTLFWLEQTERPAKRSGE